MTLSRIFPFFRTQTASINRQAAGSAPYALPSYPTQGDALVPLFNAKDIFSAENALIKKAESGDDVWLTIYEIQNEKINGDKRTSKGLPGFDEQQQIVPELVAAHDRGANVHIVADVSDFNGKPSENLKLIRYMKRKGLDIRPYPVKLAKIDHTKNLALIHHLANGKTEYWGIGAGGMNMGNHSPGNHDTMILMAGLAPYNMLVHVIRPQWAVCGGDVSSLPTQEVDDPELKWANTAPPEENNGVAQDEIKKAYLDLTRKSLDLIKQGYKPHIRASQFVLSNPAVVYALRDNALVGANVEIVLDPNMYADQAAQQYKWETWSKTVLESGGVNIKFFNADTKIQQKLHDKWITLSYSSPSGDGKETPVELITGSANPSKAGLEPAGPVDHGKSHPSPLNSFTFADEPLIVEEGGAQPLQSSPVPGFAGLMSFIGKQVPVSPFKEWVVNAGKNVPEARRYYRRTNREADAIILNHDIIRQYNAMFDEMMANQTVDAPPEGSGFSDVF